MHPKAHRIFGIALTALVLASVPATVGHAAEPTPDETSELSLLPAVLDASGNPLPSVQSASSDEGPAVVSAARIDDRSVSAMSAAATVINPPVSLGNGQYLCRYIYAQNWHYDSSGAPASWSKIVSNDYTHYGAQDLRNSDGLGSSKTSTYMAEIGEGRMTSSDDAWQSVTAKFPWSYKGDFEVSSQFSTFFGFSEAHVDYRNYVDLRLADVSTKLEVNRETLSSTNGVPKKVDNLVRSGNAERTITGLGPNQTIYGYFGTEVEMTAKTVPLTTAQARFDFSDNDGQKWTLGSTMEWVWTMKPNWYLSDCGSS